MMGGTEFKRFKEDIRTRKLQEPIVTYEGKILDGRNRYKACKELDLTPTSNDTTEPIPLALCLVPTSTVAI